MAGLVKHYQDTMQGIPQLSNSWGSMINLLDAVLVNGFNHVPVISVSKSTPEAITATINLSGGHGFIDRQVVRISGSTNGWDGDYKVLSAGANSIQVECLPEQPSVANGTATCFTAPLDFEIAYQTPAGSLEPKRAYRSTDPESLGLILLVHDFCVSGAATTGAKFAKVGVVSSMSDIDTISGNQMPYDPENPNLNWGWDGTHHGWAKWYYRVATGNSSDAQAATNGISKFYIAGNSQGFAYLADIPNLEAAGGWMTIDDVRFGGKNSLLIASNVKVKVPQSTVLQLYARSPFSITSYPESNVAYGGGYISGCLYYNSTGAVAPLELLSRMPMFSLSQGGGSITGGDIPVLFDMPAITTNNWTPIATIPFFKIGIMKTGLFTTNYGKVVCRKNRNNNDVDEIIGLTLETT
ncbi:hypothetical protein ACBP83_07275 [Acinetobacter pseudolwoffii]|uniref:hypothetical protein n=1 Tax=Acinetobacter pseudolwoffii TaxID=2053287 RepID=UPI003525A556